MSYTYTVKAGDNLNAIAQAHGFSNYKDAGIASVPSGDFNLIRPNEQITLGNYDPNKVSTVPTKTAPIISSTDNQQQFRNDSTSIDTLIGSLNTKVDPVTGQPIKEEKKTETPVVKTDGTTESTTGNAVYDNIQKDLLVKKTEAEKDGEARKVEYAQLFKTDLANLNATTQAMYNNINNIFDRRVKERTRLNSLSTASVQAYGLSNGGQYTPIAFKDAITAREQEGADYLSELELQRNDLINKAKNARDEGESGLMRKYLDDNKKVEDEINNTYSKLSSIATEEYRKDRQATQDALTDKRARIAESRTALNAISGLMADEYSVLDHKKKDEYIRKIMMAKPELDYPTIASILEGAVAKKAKDSLATRKEEASVDATEALAKQRNTPKVVKPKAETKLKAEQVLGTAMTEFKTKMQQKGWKGVSKDDYDVWYNYINTEYGQASANKLQKYLDDEGISVDTQ